MRGSGTGKEIFMKKLWVICIISVLVLALLVSCEFNITERGGTENTFIEEQTNNTIETGAEPSDAESSGGIFEISLLKSDIEGYDIFKNSPAVDFSATTFQDKSATSTLEITLLGNKYELEYFESAYLPLNAYPVHAYKIKGTEYSEILISAETGKVVKYSNIPIKVLYTTEQEYKAFIQEIVGQQYALLDYEYKCTTWRYIFTDDSMKSNVADGFHVCEDNEILASYSFYFDKTIGRLETLEHISAEFGEDSFSLEIYDFDYEDNVFVSILSYMNAWQKEMQNYLGSEVSDGFTVSNIESISHTLFLRNGIPYVKSYVNVEYSSANENDIYIQRVATVACISSESNLQSIENDTDMDIDEPSTILTSYNDYCEYVEKNVSLTSFLANPSK